MKQRAKYPYNETDTVHQSSLSSEGSYTLRKFLKKDLEKPIDRRKASSKSKLNAGGTGRKLSNTDLSYVRKPCREANRDDFKTVSGISRTFEKTESLAAEKENIFDNRTGVPITESKCVASPSATNHCHNLERTDPI